jgi:argonaute-like protein implicated in RNA metabolism and viral defense
LKEGIASQMVDKQTVLNPDWRDLNLALNIYAKAGNTPWVLDEAIPEVDMFIGLSYSQRSVGGTVKRAMSYVNVFDSYGRWKFYEGDAKSFPFDDRLQHFENLVKDAVASYMSESTNPLKNIHIHYSKKFSWAERVALAKAIRKVASEAVVTFVSINTHHQLRLYDVAENGDGSISRAFYLYKDDQRLYLTTTGKNVFNSKGMGTPIPLELTVWSDPVEARPDLEIVAQQILSLTRLNWASSRSFCHEPITTKYAGDIAKKMSAFMDDPSFFINPKLRNTPWFL